MAFKSFLIQIFENTHENTFFRTFSTHLKKSFHSQDGLAVLIGNLSCNGHQIDALFISRNKIIVIDFKNYGGKLTFSENNPWQISSGKDFTFVKGGGGIRNPFQQVNAYRHSLIQFLSPKLEGILDKNHVNFNLGHLSSMVIFHQPVEFNNDSMPQNIQKYFSISDNNHCIEAIIDRASSELNLNPEEISKMLKALDITEDNLYDETKETEVVKPLETDKDAVNRLELVRKILSDTRIEDETNKILTYYEALINLERQKEPLVQDEHPMVIDWAQMTDSLILNLENNPEFHQRYQSNLDQHYPKSMFIGINFLYNEQTIPLLHSILSTRDILSHTYIEIPFNDFLLYSKPLEERNYPDELIEELVSALSQKNLLHEKIQVLNSYLDGVFLLLPKVTLAFSEESPFTSQLMSEFKKIKQNGLVPNNSLLHKVLHKKPIEDKVPQIAHLDFIQISPLNSFQMDAVRQAFNQPLTVITGPPGTGKTQVVLNILANAVIHNKKVLLASKNNQAVDNVKDRMSALVRDPNFFLRFGSKLEIKEKTLPIIESYISRIHARALQDNSETLDKLQGAINEKKGRVEILVRNLQRGKFLEKEIPELQQKIERIDRELMDWIASDEGLVCSVFQTVQSAEIRLVLNNCIRSKNEVLASYSGINKLIFNMVSLKKHAISLTTTFETLPSQLKELAIRKGVEIRIKDLKNGDKLIQSYEKIIGFLNKGLDLIERRNLKEKELAYLRTSVEEMYLEVNTFHENEQSIRQDIQKIVKEIGELGLPLYNEMVDKIIRLADASHIMQFKEFIPDSIPWQAQAIEEFESTTHEFLKTFRINAITSLSVKSAFPLTHDLFDMVVIDEASQCDIASAIPLILRAKQLVVIGDPLQLKHISKVQPYEEKYIQNTLSIDQSLKLNYVKDSLYDYCFGLSVISRSRSVLLREHFRCHPSIIAYSNKAFYGPRLGQELIIKTNPEDFKIRPNGIHWLDVEGQHGESRNINQEEANKAIELAIRLAKENDKATIGITTPFNHQAKLLGDAIPANLRSRIKADTVHRFQGDEKDIIILSLVLSTNSPAHKANWINRKVPYLINVAVTRAKNTLYIIGNASYCRKLDADSPIGLLVRYVDSVN